MDLTKTSILRGKFRESALFRMDGKWHYAPRLVGEPTPNLIELVWQMRTDGMTFYHLLPELEDFGLTIEDLYNENPAQTIQRLREAIEREASMKKFLEEQGVAIDTKKRRNPIQKLIHGLSAAPKELLDILEEALALYPDEKGGE